MSEKEYIVTLHRNVDDQAFNEEMIATTGSGSIPIRSVGIANLRPISKRNTHYMLTDEEAETLRNDPRVMAVEIPPEHQDHIGISPTATQTGDFSKTTEDRGFFINWGLRRLNEATNPYVGNTVTGGYNYTLDGTGVDIVIQDTGIQADHPEFNDYQGVSRVQQIDWYAESGLAGTMPTDHYTDFHGHGTHVGATAAGLTYGFAKNARIYAVKVRGLEGDSDPNLGIPTSDCFDVIKGWHLNKPINPATGERRPTIVNMSWGYFSRWTSVSEVWYRGVSYTGAAIDTGGEIANLGFLPLSDGISYKSSLRITSIDADVQELIDAGVHVCVAAGNSYYKIDVVGGDDYNNYAETNAGTIYYHRGSSPFDDEAHIVGNIDSEIDAGGLEQKAQSSNTGPGVSIYAPGTDIMAAASTVNVFGDDGPYPANTNYKIANISGTSMASPQIAGVLALYTQINPGATPAQAKTFLESTAQTDKIYSPGSATTYTNYRSLLGGNNKFAFNKFNSAVQLRMGTQAEVVEAESATYSLATSVGNVNEGESVTVTLTTTNVADGTSVGYTVTGIDSADIGESLTGSFVVNSNTASKVFTLAADATTEGTETMTISLIGVSETVTVTVNDTSVAPTYTATPVSSTIAEGSVLTVDVATTDVPDGTTLYWTVSQPGEFITSTGSFTITSGAGTFTVTPAEDALTEGDETFTVSIRTGSTSGTIVDTTSNITITDSSVNPSGTIYNVTVATGTNQYGTGNKYYIEGFAGASPTLNLTEGQTYVFRQSDSSNATHQLLFSTTPNGTWGGGVEYTEGVTKVGTAGQLGAYTEITVAIGAPTLYYYCINHSGMGGTANTPSAGTPIYDSLTSSANANEGDTVVFTLSTQNIDDGTTVGYTISGIDAGDLSAGSLTGSITINSNSGSTSVTLDNDLTTEGTETMTMTLDATDSAANNTGSLTSQTVIADTSTAPLPTYTLSGPTSVDEGEQFNISLATTNVADGTNLTYTITGITSDDLSSGQLTGTMIVNSNSSIVSITPTEDNLTEGAETLIFSLDNGGDSIEITVNDTSTTPVFSPDYTITVTNSGNNYLLSGSDRNGSFTNSSQPTLAFNSGDNVRFNVNAGTAAAHPFYIKTTQSTGTGNQVSGVDGQGTTQLDWTTATDGAGSYGYQCSIHFGMWNTITIS